MTSEFEPKEAFRNPVQIGMIVKDLDRYVNPLKKILGMGPFQVVDFPPKGTKDVSMIYKGKPSSFKAKFCFVDLGNIELELIQPLEGETIWQDFLDEYGDGLHHLKFSVPRIEPVVEYMAQQDIDIVQSGSAVGKNTGKTWLFFGTKGEVGFEVEIINEIVD